MKLDEDETTVEQPVISEDKASADQPVVPEDKTSAANGYSVEKNAVPEDPSAEFTIESSSVSV
jgi:hypothetical protein